jgi:hypothetical protein
VMTTTRAVGSEERLLREGAATGEERRPHGEERAGGRQGRAHI